MIVNIIIIIIIITIIPTVSYCQINNPLVPSGFVVRAGMVVGTENNEVKTNKLQSKCSCNKINQELPPKLTLHMYAFKLKTRFPNLKYHHHRFLVFV